MVRLRIKEQDAGVGLQDHPIVHRLGSNQRDRQHQDDVGHHDDLEEPLEKRVGPIREVEDQQHQDESQHGPYVLRRQGLTEQA